MPRFHRTALSYILHNRFYIGELHRNGHVYQGKYKRFIDRDTFDICQDILSGRNRRTGNPDLPYSGELFRCAYCGQAITGEKIRRKLRCGGVREHVYYRCANNNPGPDHPKVRWRASDLERRYRVALRRTVDAVNPPDSINDVPPSRLGHIDRGELLRTLLPLAIIRPEIVPDSI